MISKCVSCQALLAHTTTQKNHGASMQTMMALFLLLIPVTISANSFLDQAHCYTAVQALKTQKDMIEDFVLKSLQSKPRKPRPHRYAEVTFHVRDFQRIGAIGFSDMRVIDNSHPTATQHADFPCIQSEIHGWKMMAPHNPSNANSPLSLTTYIPNTYRAKRGAIEIEAHFIVPKTDAPKDDIEEYIRVGFLVDATKEGEPIGEDGTLFIASNDIRIPNKSSFGNAKATHISATVRIKNNARPKDLLRILLKRISVAGDKTEFAHHQGITLNALTIRYPI